MSRAPSDQPPAADARLAQAWREASRDEPPAGLDEAIRAAARQAVRARPRPLAGAPFGGRWRVPLSVAAVLVVSATITLLVAEREKHDSQVLHDQAAPSLAVPAPQTYSGESTAEPFPAPARQFAEPGAPAANLAPRERESVRTPQPAREERKLQSAAAPPPASAEKAQARTLPVEQSAVKQSPVEQSPVEQPPSAQAPVEEAPGEQSPGEQSAGERPMVQTSPRPGRAFEADQRQARQAESAQAAAAGVPPAPAVERGDASLREAPASAAEPAADPARRDTQAVGRAKQRAAPDAPSAPAGIEAAQERAAAGRPPAPRAVPAAPAAEGGAAADDQSLEPKAWLDRILELRRQGKLEEVEKGLKAFRERYPGYPLPEELKHLVR